MAQAQQMEVLGLPSRSAISHSLEAQDIVPVHYGNDPDWCRGYPGWYASGDAIFLHRGGTRGSTIIVADRSTINDRTDDIPLLDASDLRFNDFETGFRTELGRSFGNGLALEGGFMMVDQWNANAEMTTNGLITNTQVAEGLSPPLPFNQAFYNADTFYEAVQQIAYYRSQLTSAEINVKATWQHCQFIRSEYVGIRYFQVRENFTLASQDEVTSTYANGIGTYGVETDNDLLGAQYGQEIGLPLFGCALLTTRAKAGLFVNSSEQETKIVDSGFLKYDARDTEANVAFVGELNVGLNVKVNKFLSVRGGYNFLWVEGLALAPEQGYPVAFTGVSPLNDNGNLFYHGFSIGVQVAR